MLRLASVRFCAFKASLAPIERAFIDSPVQELLKAMTLAKDERLHERIQSDCTQSRQIKLVTLEQFEKLKSDMHKESIKKLDMPPVLTQREESQTLMECDPLLRNRLANRMGFVDTSLYVSDSERLVWFRDREGNLVKASGDERRRWIQTFINRPHRDVHIPEMFTERGIAVPLECNYHEYILSRACWQFEPDDPDYIQVCLRVYFDINEKGIFETLQSTRFYGPMVFYLCWYKRADRLLSSFVRSNNRSQALNLLKLYCAIHSHTVSKVLQDAVDKCSFADALDAYCEHEASDKTLVQEAINSFKKENADLSSK